MRNRRVVAGLSLVAAIGAVTAVACARSRNRSEPPGESAGAGRADTAGARRAIARMNAEVSGLATTRNADSLAQWFAPDAAVFANGAPPIYGRDSIRAFYGQFFEAMPIRDMGFATEEVTVSGDLAIETGRSTLSLGGPGQTTPVAVAGKYLSVWRRQPDGRWLLWRHAPSTNALPR